MKVLRTFLKGAVFGLGFGIALIGAVFVAATLTTKGAITIDGPQWSDLSAEEMASKASALYVVRFKPANEGRLEGRIAEVHKKSVAIEVAAREGDRREKDDFYSKDGSLDRNGVLVFLTGSPASEAYTAYLYQDRIVTMGDMPLELFLRKFHESGTSAK